MNGITDNLPSANTPHNNFHVAGDAMQGDKVLGNKVMGNQYTYILEGKRITLPARWALLAYVATLHQTVDFARWADLPATAAEPLFEASDGLAPDTYIGTHARPLPTRVSAFRVQGQEQAAQEVVETLLDGTPLCHVGRTG